MKTEGNEGEKGGLKWVNTSEYKRDNMSAWNVGLSDCRNAVAFFLLSILLLWTRSGVYMICPAAQSQYVRAAGQEGR